MSVGKSYSALVLATMLSKYQKRGAQGEKYKKAEHYYEMAMSDTFFNLLVSINRWYMNQPKCQPAENTCVI